MKVVGRQKLLTCASDHEEVRFALSAWLREVELARWRQAEDVRSRFPNARMMDDYQVLFLVLQQRYSMQVRIHYKTQILVVQNVVCLRALSRSATSPSK